MLICTVCFQPLKDRWPMGRTNERKCFNCGELFQPDYRNRNRQRSCSKASCRKTMKAARQKRWLSKPENENYFRGSEHVERVREWRRRHPEYWKQAGKEPQAPLQDALNSQHIVLIGLISRICGTTHYCPVGMSVVRCKPL